MTKNKNQKIDTKTQQAQNRNKYFQHLKKIYDQIHPELFVTLTPKLRTYLYLTRGTVIRTQSEKYAPRWLLEYCDDFIRDHMRATYMEIIPGKLSLNLLEYSYYFIPFEACCREMKQLKGKEWFDELITKKDDRINQYDGSMNAIANLFMMNASNQQHTMYSLEYKMFHDIRSDEEIRVNQHFMLKAYNPREFMLWFDNDRKKNRVALEVVYNNHPFMMLPSKLGFQKDGEEKLVPVFILRHALKRLEERLECLVTGYSEAQIVPSMLKANVCHAPNGAVLVEYYMKEKKAGYLQVYVDENAILIRTFLFLTNTSTPEGQKLRKHLCLQREDVKYLNIDRLSPLMESDILQDEEVCHILRLAGCESLIELCEELKNSVYWNHSEEKKQLAKKLKNYMQLGKNE